MHPPNIVSVCCRGDLLYIQHYLHNPRRFLWRMDARSRTRGTWTAWQVRSWSPGK